MFPLIDITLTIDYGDFQPSWLPQPSWLLQKCCVCTQRRVPMTLSKWLACQSPHSCSSRKMSVCKRRRRRSRVRGGVPSHNKEKCSLQQTISSQRSWLLFYPNPGSNFISQGRSTIGKKTKSTEVNPQLKECFRRVEYEADGI